MWQLHLTPHSWERLLLNKRLHLPYLPKTNHWKQNYRKPNKVKDAHKKPRSQLQHWHGGRKRADEGVLEEDPTFDEVIIHTSLADQKRPEGPKQITLADISIDLMTEAFATVDMPVASKMRASLQCKVDTGAGNVMPLYLPVAGWGLFTSTIQFNSGSMVNPSKYSRKEKKSNKIWRTSSWLTPKMI